MTLKIVQDTKGMERQSHAEIQFVFFDYFSSYYYNNIKECSAVILARRNSEGNLVDFMNNSLLLRLCLSLLAVSVSFGVLNSQIAHFRHSQR